VARKPVGSVDAYIAKHPASLRPTLRRVRRIIRNALPGAEEAISYRIPAYKLHGRSVVYFAGWKRHWSLYPVTGPVRARLGLALASYEVSKGTVRFPLAASVPARLVKRIVTELARAAERRKRIRASSRRSAERTAASGGRKARSKASGRRGGG
jgi:uncharacterized protein YdhG (YjbR/CyaY superfamily)